MVKAEANIFINAPPEKVYDLVINSEKLPDWMPLLIEVHDIEGKGVGQQYKWTYKFMGIKFEGVNEVLEQEPNKKSVIKSKAGIDSLWTWTIEEAAGGTNVNVLVEYTIPIPVLGKFAEGFVVKQGSRDVKHALETLKHMLEA